MSVYGVWCQPAGHLDEYVSFFYKTFYVLSQIKLAIDN